MRAGMVLILSVMMSLLFTSFRLAEGDEVNASYIYTLSGFNGPIPYSDVSFALDEERNEVFVLNGSEIRVFNEAGMEVFSFGEGLEIGPIVSAAVNEDGSLFLLTLKSKIYLADFKGELIGEIALGDVPAEFSGISLDRIFYRGGSLYLVSSFALKVMVTDPSGHFQRGYDIASILGLQEKDKGKTDIWGFSVDRQGDMLFTIPVLATAYVLRPDGTFKAFGEPGSRPGQFGVVSGIVRDEHGYYYVADKLRAVVIVFDEDFKFITEFGEYGARPQNLISPGNLLVDGGRLYVSQPMNRGVSVFKLNRQLASGDKAATSAKGGDKG